MSSKPSSSNKAPAPQPEPALAVPQVSPLEVYVETHFRSILIGFVVIVVAVLGYGVVSYLGNKSAEDAAIELTAAKTVEDFDLVVQHHPGSIAAGNALLFKAQKLWSDNKKDTAVAALREFVAKYTSHPFYTQALISLASRLESLGGKTELTEAKGLYEKVISDNPKTDIAALAELRLADILWNDGKVDEAKKVYDSLPQKMTGSPYFAQNEDRLKWLGASLPTKEVEGPKPPPDSLKAPAPGAPPSGLNLNSGAGSPLGGLMNNIKASAPNADIKVSANPAAVPATPKPGQATPGAAIPINVKPGANGLPTTATSAPVKVEVPAGGKPAVVTPVTPAPAADAAKPAAPPAPAPAPAPAAK